MNCNRDLLGAALDRVGWPARMGSLLSYRGGSASMADSSRGVTLFAGAARFGPSGCGPPARIPSGTYRGKSSDDLPLIDAAGHGQSFGRHKLCDLVRLAARALLGRTRTIVSISIRDNRKSRTRRSDDAGAAPTRSVCGSGSPRTASLNRSEVGPTETGGLLAKKQSLEVESPLHACAPRRRVAIIGRAFCRADFFKITQSFRPPGAMEVTDGSTRRRLVKTAIERPSRRLFRCADLGLLSRDRWALHTSFPGGTIAKADLPLRCAAVRREVDAYWGGARIRFILILARKPTPRSARSQGLRGSGLVPLADAGAKSPRPTSGLCRSVQRVYEQAGAGNGLPRTGAVWVLYRPRRS